MARRAPSSQEGAGDEEGTEIGGYQALSRGESSGQEVADWPLSDQGEFE